MFCPNCGANIADDSTFCEYCGTNLSAAQQPPEQTEQPVWQQSTQEQSYIPQDNGTYRMSVRTASLLCYWFSFIGWVLCYALADNRDPYLRFHLNQSLIFCILSAIAAAVSKTLGLNTIGSMLSLALFVLWLIAFIGSCKRQMISAPLIGMIPPILK